MSDGVVNEELEATLLDQEDDPIIKKSKKKKKKRRASSDSQQEEASAASESFTNNHLPLENSEDHNEEPKEKKTRKNKSSLYTISIALPGSILANAQSPMLKSYLVGQIARAAAIFNIDEVIIFDDYNGQHKEDCQQMIHVLQYLECPQYLRKFIFPVHSDLQYAGAMNPLDIPHHLRKDEMLPYREGIVIKKPLSDRDPGCFVHVGLEKDVHVNSKLAEGLRVTIKFDEVPNSTQKKKRLTGTLVDPTEPKFSDNLYWGYSVRFASNFSGIFKQCPFPNSNGKYDLTIGTSDKGISIDDEEKPFQMKHSFKHLLIVFGGLNGLEFALENDESLVGNDVSLFFDHYLNICPGQGSRTIRTEEAILIAMGRLKPFINTSQTKKKKTKKEGTEQL